MGDSFQSPNEKYIPSSSPSKKTFRKSLVASSSKFSSHPCLKQIASLGNGKVRREAASNAALFLLKVGALETVRRLSKANCPFVWSGLQGLQVFCYPPFKWLQRWDPFRSLVKSMQGVGTSPQMVTKLLNASVIHMRFLYWILSFLLYNQLQIQGFVIQHWHIHLPQIGCFSSTLNWKARESMYQRDLMKMSSIDFILQQMGFFLAWCHLLRRQFVGGRLIELFLGKNLRCGQIWFFGMDLMWKTDPAFLSDLVELASVCHLVTDLALLKQLVEHGILHLVDSENSQITVLVDCEGLSLRFPMQLVRSCSALLQDNFPNHLGCLIVIRLPPVVRVLAQTFIQVLKPVTRQKLKIEGPMFRKVLSEYLKALPSYLDGECTCSRCANLSIRNMHPNINDDMAAQNATSVHINGSEGLSSLHTNIGMDETGSYDQALRSAVVGILILWVMIAFIAGLYDPESRPTLAS